jgi:hypothetical protein
LEFAGSWRKPTGKPTPLGARQKEEQPMGRIHEEFPAQSWLAWLQSIVMIAVLLGLSVSNLLGLGDDGPILDDHTGLD